MQTALCENPDLQENIPRLFQEDDLGHKGEWTVVGQGISKKNIDNVIPFLNNSDSVMCPYQTTFLHDKVLCMSALATQHLLRANNIDFFGNSEWPGSLPDLGTILED